MDSSATSRSAFGVALTPVNLMYAFIGCMLGTLIGVLPGIGPGGDDRDAAADDLCAAARIGAHHAGRHLLRRAVRRLDDRRSCSTCPANRRRSSPASTATRWRARARPGAALAIAALGSFFAGTVATMLIASVAVPLSELALQVRAGRIFLADGAGADRRGGARERLARQGDRDDRHGPAARHRRHRRQLRHAALRVRHSGAVRRHRRRRRRDGPVRLRRDHHQPRDRRKSASSSPTR